MRIGVLALQGAFVEHEKMLRQLGVECFEIRQKKDIECRFDGLILPGGESTVIGKLMKELGLYDEIKKRIKLGLPVFGTCAGLILLAESLVDDSVRHLATMQIEAQRNAYGRQLGSFTTEAMFTNIGVIPMTFIRAPYITHVWGNTNVLAEVDGKIVAAQQGNQLATAFHPELSNSTKVHEYFIQMIQHQNEKA